MKRQPESGTQDSPPTPVPDVTALGDALRRQRQTMGLTQAEAAGLGGVSHRLWSEVERGARPNASLSSVIRMLQTVAMDLMVRPRSRAPREPVS